MAGPLPIEFSSVSKSYRDFFLRKRAPALQDFSLQVGEGQILGLLGPNGSGKSTALNLCVGLLKPSAGSVRLYGKNPRSADARRVLGFLPEENANLPTLSARQIVETHGQLFGLGRKEARAKAQELLERVGLGDALDRKSKTYSKGMGRRLGLAQCLVGSPTVLVLDEPTSGLDPVATELVRELLLEVKAKGVSVLLSSHLLAEIEDICDQLVVLKKGRSILSGSATDLLKQREISQITTDALTEAQLQSLSHWAASQNIDIKSVTSPNRSLSAFYREHVDVAEGQAE